MLKIAINIDITTTPTTNPIPKIKIGSNSEVRRLVARFTSWS